MSHKSREERLADFQSELIDLVAMTVEVEGHDEHLDYSMDMEDLPHTLHLLLPENCTYHLTIRYRVKKRPLHKLTYYQVVKKHGVPFKTRKSYMTDVAEVNTEENPAHIARFPSDEVPSGMLVRGKHPATSKIYEGDTEIFSCDWFIEVGKKGILPSKKGYD